MEKGRRPVKVCQCVKRELFISLPQQQVDLSCVNFDRTKSLIFKFLQVKVLEVFSSDFECLFQMLIRILPCGAGIAPASPLRGRTRTNTSCSRCWQHDDDVSRTQSQMRMIFFFFCGGFLSRTKVFLSHRSELFLGNRYFLPLEVPSVAKFLNLPDTPKTPLKIRSPI